MIHITFEDYYFSPGKQMNGVAHVTLSSYLQNSQINLKITGTESTAFIYVYYETVERRNPRYNPHDEESNEPEYISEQVRREEYLKDSRGIYACDVVIYQGPLQAGNFSFPISFTLPNDIPNSFSFYKSADEYAKISYILDYKIRNLSGVGRGAVFAFETRPMLVKEEFLGQSAYNEQKKFKTQNPHYCCCCSVGEIKMAAKFEKQFYEPGEVANVGLEVNAEKLKTEIKSIEGVCTQFILINCEGRSHSWIRVISTYKKAGMKKEDKQRNRVVDLNPLILVDENEMSTNGKLVSCNYTLSAKCRLDMCCCGSSDPEISVPIIICKMPMQEERFEWEVPEDFRPTVMRKSVFNVQLAQDYAQMERNFAKNNMGNEQHSGMNYPTAPMPDFAKNNDDSLLTFNEEESNNPLHEPFFPPGSKNGNGSGNSTAF